QQQERITTNVQFTMVCLEQLQFNNSHIASISSKTSLNLIELLKWSMEILSASLKDKALSQMSARDSED
ncbi:hypothetical protein N8151_03260, partial [Flavobacteriaceae bacterium]|nr:hypothetical protein [Flavobacteriaceae bacterium]